MNVLVIACHPDDTEIECGGTVAKCVARGDKVTVCHVSSGSLGHMVIMPDELKKIRAQEAQNAGALIGTDVIWAGFDDLDIYDNNKEARDRLVDVIRYANPDFIITHNPDDYMPDHTAVSRLAFDASFAATLPHYEYTKHFSDENSPISKLVPIYYMSSANGVGFIPEEYVDITDYIDVKLDMLACHKSQHEWLGDHTGTDFIEKTRTVSRYLGYQCGATYAEGFRVCRASLKLTTKRYLP